MELKELIFFYKRHLRSTIFVTFLFLISGIILYYVLPTKYLANGSIFVVREADLVQRNEFTYEGFYAQQNASEYAKTVVGILESIEIQKKIAEAKGDEVTEPTLRKAKRMISVKKVAPQVINLQIESLDYQQAYDLWKVVAEETLNSSETISQQGDTGTSIVILESSPIVHESFRELWAFCLVGTVFGFIFSSLFSALKEYLS